MNFVPEKMLSVLCGWCESDVPLDTPSRRGNHNAGRNLYCSEACAKAADGRGIGGRFECGPCPTCGQQFRSRRREKKYCCLKCYTSSDEILERLRGLNAARMLPPGSCRECGEKIHLRRKFCGDPCRRVYYDKRFDRWIANPQTIALPQNFDEYLVQEELECLIGGCDWVGKNLAMHCNVVHGIAADDMKELAGFNRHTGLVSIDLKRWMAEKARRMMAEGMLVVGNIEQLDANRHLSGNRSRRLEGNEHRAKSQAELMANPPTRPPLPCRQCGSPAPQAVSGLRIYCSLRCRAEYYKEKGKDELTCAYCGVKFLGVRGQVLRNQRGQNVCCSHECRNRLNIVAALAARGLKSK